MRKELAVSLFSPRVNTIGESHVYVRLTEEGSLIKDMQTIKQPLGVSVREQLVIAANTYDVVDMMWIKYI